MDQHEYYDYMVLLANIHTSDNDDYFSIGKSFVKWKTFMAG